MDTSGPRIEDTEAQMDELRSVGYTGICLVGLLIVIAGLLAFYLFLLLSAFF